MCRKDGNPFNNVSATTGPAPPPHSPVTAPPGAVVFGAPSSGRTPSTPRTHSAPSTPTKQADGPTAEHESNSGKSKKTTKRVVWISIAGVLLFIILLLGFALFFPRCSRRERADRISKLHQIGAYGVDRQNTTDNAASVHPPSHIEKGN